MDVPFLSVMVIAHDRRRFLKEAVTSVMSQSVDKNSFEIVLVTNFTPDEDLLEIPNLTYVSSETKELELKIAKGLLQCRGEIICFLEDDDTWKEERLATVLDIFESNPEIVFYHNNFRIIDKSGKQVSHPTLQIMQKRMRRIGRVQTDKSKASFGDIRKLVKIGANFNLSCMAIRKSVLNEYTAYLSKLKGHSLNVDNFVFYTALLSGHSLVVDENELTNHRMHADKISKNYITADTTPEKLGFSTLLEMTGREEPNRIIRRSIECMISDLTFEIYSASNVRSRTLMAKAIVNHLRYFSRYDMQYDILLALFGLLYLVSPFLGEIMHSIPIEHL